jgi:hypothetical protein
MVAGHFSWPTGFVSANEVGKWLPEQDRHIQWACELTRRFVDVEFRNRKAIDFPYAQTGGDEGGLRLMAQSFHLCSLSLPGLQVWVSLSLGG